MDLNIESIDAVTRAKRLEEIREQLRLAREDVAAGRVYDLEAVLAEWESEDEAFAKSSGRT